MNTDFTNLMFIGVEGSIHHLRKYFNSQTLSFSTAKGKIYIVKRNGKYLVAFKDEYLLTEDIETIVEMCEYAVSLLIQKLSKPVRFLFAPYSFDKKGKCIDSSDIIIGRIKDIIDRIKTKHPDLTFE